MYTDEHLLSEAETKDEKRCESEKTDSELCKISTETEIESDSNFDSNLKYETELRDKPEVLAFITRLQEYIKKQERKIRKLKSSLKRFKSKKKKKDVAVQTGETDHVLKDTEPKTLSEEIKEAAEDAMHQTGFVYEATSGMYYDYNTGYYYNAELGLYYDGNNGVYLIYNEDTKSYDFHSQIDRLPTSENPAESDPNIKRKKQHKEQVKSDNIDGLLQNFSQLSIDHSQVSKSWPPCMRIILKETPLTKLKQGSLFIITCDGGSIGREGDQAVLIPDINVSKNHASITFDRESSKYTITDLGSQNGTFLNGKRISAPKQKSEPQEIVHGSIIQIGATKLLCHIHEGQKTCGHCEPGLLQLEPATQDSERTVKKSVQHKKELRRLRKKFGLETQCPSASEPAPGYSDRAKERRKNVGSTDSSEKTQVASVHESIASDNKGFKMLSKMGWTEGQALGKDGAGLTEPVPLVSNQGTTGLGNFAPESMVLSRLEQRSDKKATVWKKAQQRYNRVKEVNLAIFKESSSSDEGS